MRRRTNVTLPTLLHLPLATLLVGGSWGCSSNPSSPADGGADHPQNLGGALGAGGTLGNGGIAGTDSPTGKGGGSGQDGPQPSLGDTLGSGGQIVAGGGTGDAGGTSGGAGQSGGGATTNNNTGAIMVYQMAGNRYGAPYTYSSASATFSNTPKTTPDCTITIIEPCTITICNLYGVVGGPDAGSGVTLPPPNAGEISITGGIHPIDLKIDSPSVSDTSLLFHSGDTLTYQAAGGDVPPFEDTVIAPESIVLSAPLIPVSVELNFELANPPQFVWSNGGASKVRITLSDGGTYMSHQAICEYDASSGAATIPAAAVDTFQRGQSGATISVYTRASKNITAGNYSVSLTAAVIANDTGQNIASGLVNLL